MHEKEENQQKQENFGPNNSMRKNQQIDSIGAAVMCIVQNNKGEQNIFANVNATTTDSLFIPFSLSRPLSVAPLRSSFHCLQNMNTSNFA